MLTTELKILDGRISAPKYATAGSAAVDLQACSVNGAALELCYYLRPGERVKIGTGVAAYIGSTRDQDGNAIDETGEAGIAGLVFPRSGLGSRGLRLTNTVGVIDSDYQGEILLAVENTSEWEIKIEPLMRIAQLVLVPVLQTAFVAVREFSSATERGAGGFGSTGIAA